MKRRKRIEIKPQTITTLPSGYDLTHIRAAASEPSSFTLTADGHVDLQAAKEEGKLPTFSIVGYTGAILNLANFYNPVIVDLTGLKATSQTIPALRSHDTDRIVGQTDSVVIGENVLLTGAITGENDDATEIRTQAKNGFKWQASIGADVVRREFLDPGKKATVNGREVTGPLVIAREAVLKEISFVPMGADSGTSASVAASDSLGSSTNGETSMNPFEKWLQAKGFDPATLSTESKTFLQASYDAEQNRMPSDSKPTKNFDEIAAAARAETARRDTITEIAAQALADWPARIDEIEAATKAALEDKTVTTEAFRTWELRLRATAPARSFGIHADTPRANGEVIEAALCRSGGLGGLEKVFDAKTLEASDKVFRHGIGLVELLQHSAKMQGGRNVSARDMHGLLRAAFGPEVQAAAFSTFSLPGTLSNVANKFLVKGFTAVDNTWSRLSSRRDCKDFKQVSSYALTGGFMYEEVGPTGEIKHGTVGELVYNNQLKTYARMFSITRTDLINDDLGALTQVPARLGRGAALSLNDKFWNIFLNNSAFFTSGNKNVATGAGSALSLTALDSASQLFINQTDPDGFPVAITPQILLVPTALKVTAATLIHSTQVANNTTANTTTLASNPFAGLYRVESSPYMSNATYTGNSAAAWYLLADPMDVPVIEVGFLNGQETPMVENFEADFHALGIQYRGVFDFGVALQEYRGGVRSAGS